MRTDDLKDGDSVTVYYTTMSDPRYFFCDHINGRDVWFNLPVRPRESFEHRGITLRVRRLDQGD